MDFPRLLAARPVAFLVALRAAAAALVPLATALLTAPVAALVALAAAAVALLTAPVAALVALAAAAVAFVPLAAVALLCRRRASAFTWSCADGFTPARSPGTAAATH